MDYAQYEQDLLEALVRAGWISSIDRNRQDTSICWSELGKEKLKNFISEINELIPEGDSKCLNGFAIYHGIIAPTKTEEMEGRISYLLPDGPFILILCEKSGLSEFVLCHSKNDDGLYLKISEAETAGQEVIIIDVNSLAVSAVPRLTPLGSKGYWGRQR